MEYISNILGYPGVSSLLPKPIVPLDSVTFTKFANITVVSSTKLCLLIGFERGFEVWDLHLTQTPIKMLSVRNSGVKKLLYKHSSPIGNLILTSLYASSEFPQNCFQVFSIMNNKVISQIPTFKDITDIESKNNYIICATIDLAFEVFNNFTRTAVIKSGVIKVRSLRAVFTASERHLAYSFTTLDQSVSGIANDIISLANNSCEGLLSIIGQEGLLHSSCVYNQINILELNSNSKLQEIHAFPVSTSVLSFSPSGELLLAAPEHGQSFHIYKYEEESFKLIYTLFRGRSNAVIVDVAFKPEEDSVVVTSNRGTSHLYEIDKASSSLVYNRQSIERIKEYANCVYIDKNDMICVNQIGDILVKTAEGFQKVGSVKRNADFRSKGFAVC